MDDRNIEQCASLMRNMLSDDQKKSMMWDWLSALRDEMIERARWILNCYLLEEGLDSAAVERLQEVMEGGLRSASGRWLHMILADETPLPDPNSVEIEKPISEASQQTSAEG